MHNNIKLELCSIDYADISKNVYKVVRLNGYSNVPIDAVPIGMRDTPNTGVVGVATYQVGECVICIVPELDHQMDSTKLFVALILCASPTSLVGSAIASDYTMPTEVNGFLDKFKDNRTKTSIEYIRTYSVLDEVPGDFHLSGDNTILTVSDDAIEVTAGYASFAVSALDGSTKSKSLINSSDSLISSHKEYVVNNLPLDVTIRKHITDPNKISSLSISSPILSGDLHAQLDTQTGSKVQLITQESEGRSLTQVTGGLAFEQRESLGSVRVPKYTTALNYDKDIKEADFTDMDVFKSVIGSKNWVKVGADKKSTTKTGFGILKSGGFVIRDKWGSEIRMENGDIQFTSARNTVWVSGGDVSLICSGVLSSLTHKGIDVLTHGKLSMCADLGAIMHSGAAVSLTGKDIDIDGKHGYRIGTPSTTIAAGEKTISLNASSDINVNANSKLLLYGQTRSIVATASSVVNLDSKSIHLAATDTVVHGDLTVTNKSYRPGKVDTTTITPGDGTGSLYAQGSAQIVGDVCSDGKIKTAGSVYADSIHAIERKDNIGVFPSGKIDKIQDLTDVKKKLDSSEKSTDNLAAEAFQHMNTLDFSMFTKASDPVEFSVVSPVYSKKGKQTINPKSAIDNAEKEGYIYPGKQVWTTQKAKAVDNLDGSILDEVTINSKESIDKLKI